MNYGTSLLEELVHCQIYVCALVSWASLVAQTVKDLPAMQETRVQTLEWDDPLEKGMATHSGLENSMWTSAHGVTGVAKSQT